jgi:hypothetical protein
MMTHAWLNKTDARIRESFTELERRSAARGSRSPELDPGDCNVDYVSKT